MPLSADPLSAFPLAELVALDDALAAADDLPALCALAPRVAELGRRLVQGDLAGLAACTRISAWNDRLTVGIIAQTARQFRLPAVGWCWLALGSEGRMEQTFLTDQDNALIFEAADAHEAAALRELFLPFAHAVNETLAACGFARCPGGIMAGNPACCLSLDEWRERFIDWVRRPDPQALLNASIFFDLRPLAGQLELGEGLRRLMLAMTRDTPSFLHLMAANALAAEPPLTFRGEVQAGADGVDLKKFGSRIFVDAARIFALAHGVPAVSTSARLALAGPAAALTPDEIPTVNAAFSHILRLRLQGQLTDEAAGRPVGHALQPASLNDVDRVILREVLHQARRLQQRLKLNYSL